MTRRRFQHCKNEKCNRRLEELLDRPGEPAPAPKFCDACMSMVLSEDDIRQRVEGEASSRGFRRGVLLGAVASAVVGLVVWAIGHVAAWIQAPPA